MARVRDILEPAPAVGDFLVLGQGVGDERESPHLALQRRRDGGGGVAAHMLLRVLHQVEDGFERQLLAFDVKPQIGDRLVEQPVPGAAAADRFLVEEFLDLIIELVGLLQPDVDEPGAIMRQRPVRHRRVERGVVDSVEFELEKQEIGRRGGDLFLRVAVEFGVGRIGRVARIDQAGVGHDAAEQILQLFVGGHGLRQPLRGLRPRRDLRQLAAPLGAERRAFRQSPFHIDAIGRALHAGIKIVEPPFGQRPEIGRVRRPMGLVRAAERLNGLVGRHAMSGFESKGRLRLLYRWGRAGINRRAAHQTRHFGTVVKPAFTLIAQHALTQGRLARQEAKSDDTNSYRRRRSGAAPVA